MTEDTREVSDVLPPAADRPGRGAGGARVTPGVKGFKTVPMLERFWSRVDCSSGEGCWPWTGTRTVTGYGRFNESGRMRKSSHVAWEIANGPIPAGLHVLHRCDNPPCVNPAHLFLGTHADNMADMAAKGRAVSGDRHPYRVHPERVRRGEAVGTARLRVDDVREVRGLASQGWSGRSIAKHLGFGRSAVARVINGETWNHVG